MTAAAEDIYLAYQDKVSAYIRGKVDHHQDAEDLVSQVFEKVYGKLHTFDETKASLSTWIYTVRSMWISTNCTAFLPRKRIGMCWIPWPMR